MMKKTILSVLAVPCIAAGCVSLERASIDIERRAPLPVRDEGILMAGAARADITGAPGFPMAGHSRLGGASRGVRTRLYARVIYLKPKNGRPVALVQADLLSGSRALHHRVAELIAGRTDIDAAGLVIAGTHTHSAQGNYFGVRLYDRMASPVPGFDRGVFDFLAGRIADAVVRAYEGRRPARVATGSITVFGAARNRSLPAYLRNPGAAAAAPGLREAVNPELRMIRVDCRGGDGAYAPIGAFSTFSMHPNLTHEDVGWLYNGDVTAYAEREVERGMRRLYPAAADPVHAIANCSHGDQTPDYADGEWLGYPAMRRIGTLIGARALELFVSLGAGLRDDVPVRYRAVEVDVSRERCLDGECLCDRPAAGEAAFGGALDRPNRFLNKLPGFAPGWPKRRGTGDCQGHKRILGGYWLQHRVFPLEEYPRILFLQAVQVHDTVLLPLPFEVTVDAGRRMADRCREAALKAGLPERMRFIVTDTANGYWGYCATPEEYSLQYYEGGQTLYGPGTAGFLAAHLSRLVAALPDGSGGDLPDRWSFDVTLMKKKKNGESASSAAPRTAAGAPTYTSKTKKVPEPYWSFRWYDVPPADIRLHEPLVSVEASGDGAVWAPLEVDGDRVDDGGWDIAVICPKRASRDGAWIYETRWYNPPPAGAAHYRFKILPRGEGGVLHSPAFR